MANQNPADVAALRLCRWAKARLESTRAALVGKIGENMSIRRFVRIEAKGQLVSYIHGGAKIGVLLDLVGGDEQLGKDIAMHIAASKPKALDASGRIAGIAGRRAPHRDREGPRRQQAGSHAGKIADGTVQKYLKEVTLLAQVFVKAGTASRRSSNC